jgi:hypothetical protein
MAFDSSKVGTHIAEQMEALEKDFGEEAEIGEICTVVEVRIPQGKDAAGNETFESQVRTRFTGHPFTAIGLLDVARRGMTGG